MTEERYFEIKTALQEDPDSADFLTIEEYEEFMTYEELGTFE